MHRNSVIIQNQISEEKIMAEKEKENKEEKAGCLSDETNTETALKECMTDVEQKRAQRVEQYEFDFSVLKKIVFKSMSRLYGVSPQFWVLALGIAGFLTLCLPVMTHAGINVVGVGFQNIFSVNAGNGVSLLCVLIFLMTAVCLAVSLRMYYKTRKKGAEYRKTGYYIFALVADLIMLILTWVGVASAKSWSASAGAGMIVGLAGSGIILLLIVDRLILNLFVVNIGVNNENTVTKRHDVPSTAFDIGIIVAGVVIVLLFYSFWPAFAQKQINENVLADCVTRAETEEKLGRPDGAEGDDMRYDYYDNNYSSLLAIIDKLELEQFELLEKSVSGGNSVQKYIDRIDEIDACLEQLNEKKSKQQYKHTAVSFVSELDDNRKYKVNSYFCEVVNPAATSQQRELSVLSIVAVSDEKWENDEVGSRLESCILKYKAKYSDGTFIVSIVHATFNDTVVFSDRFGSYEIEREQVEEFLMK